MYGQEVLRSNLDFKNSDWRKDNGKKPLYIKVNGALHEVTEELYLIKRRYAEQERAAKPKSKKGMGR